MFCYRQLWESLAHTGSKLNQRLIDIMYNAVIQVYTPSKKQTKIISLPVACLSFSKNIRLASNNFHSSRTNKIIFWLGKNKFIRLPAACLVAGMEAGRA